MATIVQPVVSAGKRPLPLLSDGPDMREAVTGWCSPMTFEIENIKAGPGGDAVTSRWTIEANGFMLPATPRELSIEADGTRRWKPWMLWVLNAPVIRVQDRIWIAARPFKVLRAWDYSQFGFHKFGLLEDFE